MIEFFLPMIPPTITQQEHRVSVVNGRARFYDPPELMAARQKFQDALRPCAPEEKITGPVQLLTKWIWPGPMGREQEWQWKTTKPDTDNLIKLFKDCMTKVGFWADDCQVVSEITEKVLGPMPGIYVKVVEL